MLEPIIFIVDDDPDMRDLLQGLLRSVGLRSEAYESSADFLERRRPRGPGCLVFDIRMPGTSGLDLYEELVRRGERMPVIFITAHADVPMVIRAMKAGATDFVEKPFNRQDFLDRVQRAVKDDVERHRGRSDRDAVHQRFQRLTPKELQVLDRIKEGQPNKAIANSLNITPRAVELRRASLMKKLGAQNLMDLLRLTLCAELSAEGSSPLGV